MTKNSFNSSVLKEDKILISYFDDLLKKSLYSEFPVFSSFLDLRQQKVLSDVFQNRLTFFGGYSDSERKMGCFSTVDEIEYPILCMFIDVPKNAQQLTNSRILGSIMSLGIERNVIGDILILNDYHAVVYIKDDFRNYFEANLLKIGHDFCDLSFDAYFNFNYQKDHIVISVLVSSLRLDCLVSSICHCSRDKAADLIKEGNVTLNFLTADKVSHKIFDGDIFSIRKYGKYKVLGLSKISKKGRLYLDIEKY